MEFELTQQQLEWQSEVRQFVAQNPPPELAADEWQGYERGFSPLGKAFLRKLADRGWYATSVPKEYGGLGKSAIEHCIFVDELDYAHEPLPDRLTVGAVAPAIIRHGTEEQKKQWLPGIINGNLTFAMAYSEPDAGTDLANLSTAARLDGDDWVINGKKIWNSGGHFCTHEWLLCRTDPDAPKHRGMSILIVPIDSNGITLREIKVLPDHRCNEVLFEDVRVPKDHLIGEVNRGWQYATTALGLERLEIGLTGQLWRVFDDLVHFCRNTMIEGAVLAKKPNVRYALADLKVRLDIAYLLSMRAAWMVDEGQMPLVEAFMAKVTTTELRLALTDRAMEIMELYGQLDSRDPAVPEKGFAEQTFRGALLRRFGGGTNEVLRNHIAQRGFGLPRGSN